MREARTKIPTRRECALIVNNALRVNEVKGVERES